MKKSVVLFLAAALFAAFPAQARSGNLAPSRLVSCDLIVEGFIEESGRSRIHVGDQLFSIYPRSNPSIVMHDDPRFEFRFRAEHDPSTDRIRISVNFDGEHRFRVSVPAEEGRMTRVIVPFDYDGRVLELHANCLTKRGTYN